LLLRLACVEGPRAEEGIANAQRIAQVVSRLVGFQKLGSVEVGVFVFGFHIKLLDKGGVVDVIGTCAKSRGRVRRGSSSVVFASM
jgi:hypothetical protein